MNIKISWSIAGAFSQYENLINSIIAFKREDISYSVYDEIPNISKFSGGRENFKNFDEQVNNKGGFLNIIEKFSEQNISFNILLTNHLIKDFLDPLPKSITIGSDTIVPLAGP